jgi:carbonic anhydrase/acetyltransferase-like protein (isoleucine patch superfamily)
MILGSPAKVVRQLSEEQQAGLRMSALHYIENAHRCKNGLKRIT